MARLALLLSLCVTVTTAASHRTARAPSILECLVGKWSPWSTCVTSNEMPGTSRDVMGVVKDTDYRRAAMRRLREMKERDWADLLSRFLPPWRRGPLPCRLGRAGIFPCRNADMLSFIRIRDLDPSGHSDFVNDMWGWTDNKNDYAIVGMNGGTTFIRVTDPEEPEILGHLPSTTRELIFWRDMKVVRDHAFIVSEATNHGMQVFDLRQLRDLAEDNTRVFEPTAFYDGVSNTHNIVANEDSSTVILVGTNDTKAQSCNGGLYMVDVSDPLNPTFLGCFGGDGYVHDAQCVTYSGPDARFAGREVCFCYNADTFTIVDVTDRENAAILSRSEYVGYAYTHQGWCTEDFNIVLMDDELDEVNAGYDKRTRTFIWDIRDLTAPELKTVHVHSVEAIDHNQYIKGNYTYQSNYKAGLRVLYIDQENYALTEVAYLDVFPLATDATFGGSWSNYPYFYNGKVGVTSSELGFFMVDVQLPETPPERDSGRGLRRRDRDMGQPSTIDSCPTLGLEQYKEC